MNFLFVITLLSQSTTIYIGENGGVGDPVASSANRSASNLSSNDAHYNEGQSIPYRVVMTGLSTSDSHTLDFEWDILRSSRNGIDHITYFQRIGDTVNTAFGFSVGSPSYFTIPTPPVSTTTGTVDGLSQPTTSFGLLSANDKRFTIYNGTITSMTYINNSDGNLGDLSNSPSATRIRVTFTASNSTIILAWGGYVASRLGWSEGNSASEISNSPYRTRLVALDGVSLTSEKTLSGFAICGPATITTCPVANTVCAGTNANFYTIFLSL